MRNCDVCGYPWPCGRCENYIDWIEGRSYAVEPDDGRQEGERVLCIFCDQWVLGIGPWCKLYCPPKGVCAGLAILNFQKTHPQSSPNPS